MRKIRSSSRSKWDICFDALAFLSEESNASRTKVENRMALTPKDAFKHLQLLEKLKCIRLVKEPYGTKTMTRCNITEKGIELKGKIQNIYDLFGGTIPQW